MDLWELWLIKLRDEYSFPMIPSGTDKGDDTAVMHAEKSTRHGTILSDQTQRSTDPRLKILSTTRRQAVIMCMQLPELGCEGYFYTSPSSWPC